MKTKRFNIILAAFIVLVTTFILAFTSSSKTSLSKPLPLPSQPVLLTPVSLAHGNILDTNKFFNISDISTAIITNQNELNSTWSHFHLSLPTVDFDHQIILLAILSPRKSTGFQLKISDVLLSPNGELNVNLTESLPNSSCHTLPSISQLYHLVVLPRYLISSLKYNHIILENEDCL